MPRYLFPARFLCSSTTGHTAGGGSALEFLRRARDCPFLLRTFGWGLLSGRQPPADYVLRRMLLDARRTLSFVMDCASAGALPYAKLILCSCNSSSVTGLSRVASSNFNNSGSATATPRNCFRSAILLHLPSNIWRKGHIPLGAIKSTSLPIANGSLARIQQCFAHPMVHDNAQSRTFFSSL